MISIFCRNSKSQIPNTSNLGFWRPKSQMIWDLGNTYSLHYRVFIPATQIQNPNAEIPNPKSQSQIPNPNYFWHPKLFLASQINFGIPNYFWHPKLFLASQIIFGIPNYFWHPKLFLASQINFD